MPTTPSVLPNTWFPWNGLRSHLPASSDALAGAIFRESASINVNASSAVETVLPSGVFITRMPLAVAAATSILSTPTPARAMPRSFPESSNASAVTFAPLRMIMPSNSPRIAPSSSGDNPG